MTVLYVIFLCIVCLYVGFIVGHSWGFNVGWWERHSYCPDDEEKPLKN